ncbi:hypothetical protein [Sorangium sp. So ce426]|uniref:hypothetical protein n=1 Tax=Sorangium sp. So ce426 TaxID=3133312 RepID=UPI003F5C25DB
MSARIDAADAARSIAGIAKRPSSVSASSGGDDGPSCPGDGTQCSFRGGADPPGNVGLAVSLFGLTLVARRRGAGGARRPKARPPELPAPLPGTP